MIDPTSAIVDDYVVGPTTFGFNRVGSARGTMDDFADVTYDDGLAHITTESGEWAGVWNNVVAPDRIDTGIEPTKLLGPGIVDVCQASLSGYEIAVKGSEGRRQALGERQGIGKAEGAGPGVQKSHRFPIPTPLRPLWYSNADAGRPHGCRGGSCKTLERKP